jgi:hypothetical protein
MNIKRAIGILILVLGIVAIAYGINAKYRIASAKGTAHGISEMTSPFAGGAVGKVGEGIVEHQTSQYDTPIMWLFAGGIVAVIVGASMVCCCCKKKKR